MTKKVLYTILVGFPLFFATCSPTSLKPKSVLVSAKQVVFYDNSILKRITSSNDSLSYQPADYQISVNRISYQTTLTSGTSFTASGIVYLPSQLSAPNRSYPILSFQHGTAYSDAEAPTGTNFSSPGFSYPLYYATHGYIVVCPDYIGYGDADQFPHEYEHRQSLAQATVDMLLAAKEFLAKKEIIPADKLFMTGYSEGGYATLSAQKLVEEQYNSSLKLTASSCGAGPYAMTAFYDYVTQKPTIGGVANYIYIWETLSYNRIYGLNKPISYYFKSPYAEQIEQSIDNARAITASFSTICTDQFRADILNPASAFRKALSDNDLTNWSTQIPTQLVHSEQDEFIPFLTTQETYQAMRQHGSSKLTLIALKKGYHVPTEIRFLNQTLSWFESLKN